MSESMRLNAPAGQKLMFTGSGGYDGQIAEAEKHLNKVAAYTVLRTEVGRSLSSVFLEEFPDQPFNTVMFEELEPLQKPQESVEAIYRRCVENRWKPHQRRSESDYEGIVE